MKAHRAGRGERQQGRGKDFQQAKAMQVQAKLPVETILEHCGNEKKSVAADERG